MLRSRRSDRLVHMLTLVFFQTNSTRAKTLELHIAQRVAAELEKIQKHETDELERLRQKLAHNSSESGSPDSSSSASSSSSSDTGKAQHALLELPSVSVKDLISDVTSSTSAEDQQKKLASTQKVQQEIEKLKQTLKQRKMVKEMPTEVEDARSRLVSCLRLNDRRPLDCWQEVQAFKREVRKMEEKFVHDVL